MKENLIGFKNRWFKKKSQPIYLCDLAIITRLFSEMSQNGECNIVYIVEIIK